MFPGRLCFVGVLILVGCAAKPIATLPDAEYQKYGNALATAHTCNAAGHISPDLAALGIGKMREALRNVSYDDVRLQSTIRKYSQQTRTASDCNNLSLVFHGWKQEGEKEAEQSRWQANENQRIMESVRQKQTYCNRIGTQVLCNSY